METKKYTISDTTSNFIQALQTIMIAENQLSEGFTMRYGEESSMIDKSGLPELIEALKDKVKKTIGDSIEITMGENWHPEDKNAEINL
mgnify:CR=1 FL=1